jgi:hypothetical protein
MGYLNHHACIIPQTAFPRMAPKAAPNMVNNITYNNIYSLGVSNGI